MTQPDLHYPSFSIVIETANLQPGDAEGLIASLDTLARQVPSPSLARSVVLMHDDGASPALLDRVRARYPWLSTERIPVGADYGDQKSMCVSFAPADIVVFADCDCFYQTGWLESILQTFATRPDIEVLAGETAVAITGPFTLAMALVFFFPRFSNEMEVAPARGFYANNVAFRRDVLVRCPFPSGLPLFRGQNVVHSRLVLAAGIPIWREPRARSIHLPPDGVLAAVQRLFFTGRDAPMLGRLASPPPEDPFRGDYEPYDRVGGRIRKVAGRVRAISRQQPRMLLLLPVALPIALACVASFFTGVAISRLSSRTARMTRDSRPAPGLGAPDRQG